MRFLMLIRSDENAWSRLPDAERQAIYDQWTAYDALLRAGDHTRGGDELEPTEQAVRIRRTGGALRVVGGPFTDVPEAVGGYYLLETSDRAEAVRLASECPVFRHGGHVELYPIRESAG